MWPRNRKPRTLQQSLTLHLSLGIVTLGIVMLVTSVVITGIVRDRMLDSLTTQILDRTEAHVRSFFEPVSTAADYARDWERLARAQDLTPDNIEDNLQILDNVFAPLIKAFKHISSVQFAGSQGDEYMLLQTPGGWKSRLTRPEVWQKRALIRTWSDSGGPVTKSWQEVDYDARNRPWFQGAMSLLEQDKGSDPQQLFWTEPYVFFTTREPGISVSFTLPGQDDSYSVIGFDVLLSEISTFTQEISASESGMVIVAYGKPDNLLILGFPTSPDTGGTSGQPWVLSSVEDFGGPAARFVKEALAVGWKPGEPLTFESNNEVWWGAGLRSDYGIGRPIWTVALIPEADLLAGIPNTNVIVTLATLLVLLLATIRSVWIARSYSHPIASLVHQGERMQRLNFQPTAKTTSHIQEINHLADTLERVRQALYTYSTEREQQRVARSIHSLSVPQALPEPAGFELDVWNHNVDEVGGDSYDVLAYRGGPENAAVSGDHPPERIAFFMQSGSGFGVDTAVKALQLRAIFRTGVRGGWSLGQLAGQMNRYLRTDTLHGGIVRAWYGLLDCDSGQFSSLTLGYTPVIFSSANNRFINPKITADALGFEDNLIIPEPETFAMAAGDILCLASDGVLHCLNRKREQFGSQRLMQVLSDHSDDSAGEIIRQLRQQLEAFADTSLSKQDQTILVLKRI